MTTTQGRASHAHAICMRVRLFALAGLWHRCTSKRRSVPAQSTPAAPWLHKHTHTDREVYIRITHTSTTPPDKHTPRGMPHMANTANTFPPTHMTTMSIIHTCMKKYAIMLLLPPCSCYCHRAPATATVLLLLQLGSCYCHRDPATATGFLLLPLCSCYCNCPPPAATVLLLLMLLGPTVLLLLPLCSCYCHCAPATAIVLLLLPLGSSYCHYASATATVPDVRGGGPHNESWLKDLAA